MKEGSSVGDLALEMLRLHPEVKGIERTVRYSVNFEIAEKDAALRDGDEVAVLPPVAGG